MTDFKYLSNRSHILNTCNVRGCTENEKGNKPENKVYRREKGEDLVLSSQWNRDPKEVSSREPWGHLGKGTYKQ